MTLVKYKCKGYRKKCPPTLLFSSNQSLNTHASQYAHEICVCDTSLFFPFSAFPPCVSRILPRPIFFWTMGHHQRSSEEGKCMHEGRGLCLIHGHTITTHKINGKSCPQRFNILRDFFQTKLFLS